MTTRSHLSAFLLAAALAGSSLCTPAYATMYALPAEGEDLVGQPEYVMPLPGDNLAEIAYRYGLGFREMVHANRGIDPWDLKPHQRVLLPNATLLPSAPRRGIVVNVPEMKLYYYPPDGKTVYVYPIAVGRLDWKTPTGTTTVTGKQKDPTWYPPETIRAEHAAKGEPLEAAVPPGPDNPLGNRVLRLGFPLILIHGTNMPKGGIGMPVTHGCVRLYPQDAEELYDMVALGTPVNFIEEPYKLGRYRGQWHLEAHLPLSENPHATGSEDDVTPALGLVKVRAENAQVAGLDMQRVREALLRSSGVPVNVEPGQAPLELKLETQLGSPRRPQTETPAASRPWDAAGAWINQLDERFRLLAVGVLVVLALFGAGIGRR